MGARYGVDVGAGSDQATETDNVVWICWQNAELAQPVQQVLTLAACIGYHFDLASLMLLSVLKKTSLPCCPSVSHKASSPKAMTSISSLMIVFRPRRTLSDEAEEEISSPTGQALLQKTPEPGRAQKLFTIVNHLNIGAALLTRQAD